MRLPAYATIVLLCCLVTCGCGGADQLNTADVSGAVTLDGQPLAKGMVIFTPAAGRGATGTIQSDGTYTLGTYGSSDGAVLGKHMVAVVAREELPGGEGPMQVRAGPSLIPELYGDAATSGLSFEVTAGGDNVYNIQLSSQATPPQ